MYKQIFRSIFIPILATILLSSCAFWNGLMKGKETAESAVTEFHNRLNAQQCSEIYEQADNRFKQQHEKDAALKACKTIHERLGKVKSSNLLGFKAQ
jgi:flagellar motility protein MotE (MotC chaperone)